MTNIASSTGCLVLWLSLSLSPPACTGDRSLGAVDDRDGSRDVQATADAADVPHDIPGDRPIDTVCADNGVSYHVGDVIPRGTSSCPISCLCLAGGVIGACTGACPEDAHPEGLVGDGVQVALIVVSASTNSPEIRVFVFDNGSAERDVIGKSRDAFSAVQYTPGSPEVTLFLNHLNLVGNLGPVGDPAETIALSTCPKSVSFGTLTKVTAGGATSGDLQCLTNPTEAQTALAHDCAILTGMDDVRFGTVANLCINTFGEVTNVPCCTGAGDFPSTCGVGACGCSLTNSHNVATCICPEGGCFVEPYGCVGPAGTCTVGADQTCNDNLTVSSIHGHCVADGRCTCSAGPLVASGKCP